MERPPADGHRKAGHSRYCDASPEMLFHQVDLNCLAHASYLIGDAGTAAVVPPQPEQLLIRPDSTLGYRAHGDGSLCGKALGKETFTRIGEQRAAHYALQPLTKEAFLDIVTADQPDLQKEGLGPVSEIAGGVAAWEAANLPLERASAPA